MENSIASEDIQSAIEESCQDPATARYYNGAPAGAKLYIGLIFYGSVFKSSINVERYLASMNELEAVLSCRDLEYLVANETDPAMAAHLRGLLSSRKGVPAGECESREAPAVEDESAVEDELEVEEVPVARKRPPDLGKLLPFALTLLVLTLLAAGAVLFLNRRADEPVVPVADVTDGVARADASSSEPVVAPVAAEPSRDELAERFVRCSSRFVERFKGATLDLWTAPRRILRPGSANGTYAVLVPMADTTLMFELESRVGETPVVRQMGSGGEWIELLFDAFRDLTWKHGAVMVNRRRGLLYCPKDLEESPRPLPRRDFTLADLGFGPLLALTGRYGMDASEIWCELHVIDGDGKELVKVECDFGEAEIKWAKLEEAVLAVLARSGRAEGSDGGDPLAGVRIAVKLRFE